jgi:lysophospholipase L1-like esterase
MLYLRNRLDKMNSSKSKNLPIFLFLIVFFFLAAMSFIPVDVSIFGIKIKKIDLFSDVKPDSLISSSFKIEIKSSGYGAAVLLPLSIKYKLNEDLEGNISQMNYFYDALKEAKSRKIKIAHFGDSIIEGDLITSDLRSVLQSKFGGDGTGMLSITPDDNRFRTTIKQTFSSDWKTYSLFGKSESGMEPGINGTVSIPSSGSWVKMETSGIPGAAKSIKKVYIYYSDAKTSSLKYSLNNSQDKTVEMQSGSGVKRIEIDAGGTKSVKITATQKDQAKFYGISLESDNGISIDNFPLRGNSGISIRDINTTVLKDFNGLLDYKLIILQFGLNMLTSGQTDFDWYEREMTKVINQMKTIFPQGSFLLVGVGDKCIKKGTRLITDPNVIRMVNSQKRIAENTGIAFFNLFEAMGGENSMLEWTNAKPPLAMKDFTHFNNEGAKKIGRMLNDAIIKNYR